MLIVRALANNKLTLTFGEGRRFIRYGLVFCNGEQVVDTSETCNSGDILRIKRKNGPDKRLVVP